MALRDTFRSIGRATLLAAPLLLAASCGAESEPSCSDGELSFRDGDPCETCVCSGGAWSCEAWECVQPECPPPLPSGEECPAQASYSKDPETGGCCRYDNLCAGPADWSSFAGGQVQCQSRHCQPGASVPAGDGCNECVCDEEGSLWLCGDDVCSSDTPPPGEACGYWEGGCDAGEYCAFDPVEACSSFDAPSVCRVQPETCTGDDAPVCGCNGITYGNRCLAAQSGTGIRDVGPCPASSVDRVCGETTGNVCTADEYCEYFGSACGRGEGDVSGRCTPRPLDCVPQLAPVCGCDQGEYANACEAARAGSSVLKSGACSG